ncbi:MAG: general stress protein [Nocardioides sp.]
MAGTNPLGSSLGRGTPTGLGAAGLSLEFPQSLGVYADYAAAQKAVDFLSDHEFPVQNCMIVGTELKQVERITGRLTTGKVALGGALSGLWFGAFVGLIFTLFDTNGSFVTVLTTALFGVLFGLVWALVGYAATRGRRDFSSVTAVVATRYEVLVEHGKLADAQRLLAQMPGNQANPFA